MNTSTLGKRKKKSINHSSLLEEEHEPLLKRKKLNENTNNLNKITSTFIKDDDDINARYMDLYDIPNPKIKYNMLRGHVDNTISLNFSKKKEYKTCVIKNLDRKFLFFNPLELTPECSIFSSLSIKRVYKLYELLPKLIDSIENKTFDISIEDRFIIYPPEFLYNSNKPTKENLIKYDILSYLLDNKIKGEDEIATYVFNELDKHLFQIVQKFEIAKEMIKEIEDYSNFWDGDLNSSFKIIVSCIISILVFIFNSSQYFAYDPLIIKTKIKTKINAFPYDVTDFPRNSKKVPIINLFHILINNQIFSKDVLKSKMMYDHSNTKTNISFVPFIKYTDITSTMITRCSRDVSIYAGISDNGIDKQLFACNDNMVLSYQWIIKNYRPIKNEKKSSEVPICFNTSISPFIQLYFAKMFDHKLSTEELEGLRKIMTKKFSYPSKPNKIRLTVREESNLERYIKSKNAEIPGRSLEYNKTRNKDISFNKKDPDSDILIDVVEVDNKASSLVEYMNYEKRKPQNKKSKYIDSVITTVTKINYNDKIIELKYGFSESQLEKSKKRITFLNEHIKKFNSINNLVKKSYIETHEVHYSNKVKNLESIHSNDVNSLVFQFCKEIEILNSKTKRIHSRQVHNLFNLAQHRYLGYILTQICLKMGKYSEIDIAKSLLNNENKESALISKLLKTINNISTRYFVKKCIALYDLCDRYEHSILWIVYTAINLKKLMSKIYFIWILFISDIEFCKLFDSWNTHKKDKNNNQLYGKIKQIEFKDHIVSKKAEELSKK